MHIAPSMRLQQLALVYIYLYKDMHENLVSANCIKEINNQASIHTIIR